MDNNMNSWLPHLEEAVPDSAYGYKLCIYTIALEGWRRGLKLKFFNFYRTEKDEVKLTVRFSLSNNEKEHKFAVSRGDLVSKKAINICVDKHRTKEYLSKANVSVPVGKSFGTKETNEEIINYFKSLNFPAVLKPTDAGGGKGVITNIKNVEELKEALQYVRGDLNFTNVILEKYIVGKDHRIYVIGNEVVGVYKRISANVIGDGKTSIEKLIDIKNKERKKNPYLSGRLIKKDKEMLNFIKTKNLSLKSIPKKEERIFIREKGSLSAGGEPIDVTDEISNEVKKTAIEAARAIPGLPQCAVDMIIDKESNLGVVNEVNSKPQISNHLYPVEGKARDIPKAIIDYYFPETKGNEINRKDSLFFDFDSILTPLKNGHVEEVTIPTLTTEQIISKKYIITGYVPKGNNRWIKKTAHSLKLYGFVESLKENETTVVVAGIEENVNKFKTLLTNNVIKNVEIMEENWGTPVMAGFEIRKYGEKLPLNDLVIELRTLKDKNKELSKIKDQYTAILRSKTWRASKPIRKIGNSIRGVKK